MRGDLLQKIIEISNRKGKTVYGFVNEIFDQAIKAEEMETTLNEISEFYSLIKTMRKAGAVLTPPDILDHSIKRLYPLEKDALIENWRNSGLWYGKFLQTKFSNPIEVFKKILSNCLWEITEAQIQNRDDGITSLRVVAPNLPIENTELLLKFIEGVINSLNYKVLKKEFWKGIILLEMEKAVIIPDIEDQLESI